MEEPVAMVSSGFNSAVAPPLLPHNSAEVATRLEFVFPAVLRASFVLFSVTYSYAVLAYAMYCSTPLGTQPIEGVADHSMMKRSVIREA